MTPVVHKVIATVVVGFAALVAAGLLNAAPAAEPAPKYPPRWAGYAKWEINDRDDSVHPNGERRREDHHTVTMRLVFGKARGYASTYEVKSGTLTWQGSGSTFERSEGVTETSCSWKVSRAMRLSKYAGTLALDQYPKGYRGVFAAADSFGPEVRFPRTCTTKYLYTHNPPVVTETFADQMPAPNPLFPLSRNVKGYAPRGKPPVIYGTGRAPEDEVTRPSRLHDHFAQELEVELELQSTGLTARLL